MKKIHMLLLALCFIAGTMSSAFADVNQSVPTAQTVAVPTAIPAVVIPKVTVVANDVKMWQMIEFTVENAPTAAQAWVGLFEYSPDAEWYQAGWESAYKAKIMIANLGTTPYFETIKSTEQKQYVIALFDQYGYDLMPVAVSEPITVEPMYLSKNMFTERAAYDAEMKQIYAEKYVGTYEIKTEMNKGVCNPNITAEEILHYITLKNSNTSFEQPKQTAYDQNGILSEIPASANWYSYPKDTTDDAAVIDSPAVEGKREMLFDNEDFYKMKPAPTKATSFTVQETLILDYLEVMHQLGTIPNADSTIHLKDASGNVYGPWPAVLGESFDAESIDAAGYTVLFVKPNAVLYPGTYTIMNAENASWLYSDYSENAGMAYIEGVIPAQGNTVNTPTTSTPTALPPIQDTEDSIADNQASNNAQAVSLPVITVRGHLYDASLAPLPNTTIQYSQNGLTLGSVTTDASGTFALTLQSGLYAFSCSSETITPEQPGSETLETVESQLQYIAVGYRSPQSIYLLKTDEAAE
ncbi:carboxypeptidase regulatory-like domain-containing protein [Fusibacter paucivorans]|uniref:Carboxypeptidase regulatory-like domain-containing protein n=1 Tax=Fusibacter paucivorans TaxID=76009 RepID=A0ABS5PNX2_9FIRM|nr:carboxypeptidase-like regulatory domain-containing protein [Fusibacter paucivorans]MBS7526873.1 carboxypeptidase regulatory-like domain-containing protein [Fusibacter paucivorans]